MDKQAKHMVAVYAKDHVIELWFPETEHEHNTRLLEEYNTRRADFAAGRCSACGLDLKTNINRGILICADTHEGQYKKFLARFE
jgi:hypothetical protein